MRLISILALLLALSAYASAQAPSKPLQLNFTGSTTSSDGFGAATDEYRDIWAKEGTRIVAAMESATGLWFEDGPIDVIVYEGPSFSGQRGGRPMQLRASYTSDTKRATLVHELGHRLAAGVPFKGEHHELIFLFVYDVWVDLWGQPFADEQVKVESLRKGLVDYEGIWKKTLVLSAAERAQRFQQIVRDNRK